MKDFWLVFRKELTCCGRDPDVLIYAFLLPLVLYPLSAVFVNEASIWYTSMQEKNKEAVYVRGQSPLSIAIASGLRSNKHFIVIDDYEKKSSEQEKKAIAVVSVDPATSQVAISAHETASHLGTVALQIEGDIREARAKGLSRQLKEKDIAVSLLDVYHVQRQGLKKPRTTGATDNYLKQLFDKLTALLVTFMILMMTIIGGPASVCMMAEEHEKKTFYTTLLLPINRFAIVFAKFLSVTAICIGGAAFNLICLALFVIFIAGSSLGHYFSLAKFVEDLQHLTVQTGSFYLGSGLAAFLRLKPYVQIPTVAELLLMVAFFCSTGALLSAIYLCVAAYAKTVKSAQMLVSLPMMFLMALPTIALIPGIQFDLQTSLIPIANQLIMRKFENPPLFLSLIAIFEPLMLVALILNWVRIVFENQPQTKRGKSGAMNAT
jgi:sodium transport system permease protein